MSVDISVIMPVWNMAQHIERSIQTVLDQQYRNFEIIVVDDGSTDDSYEILSRIAQKDQRVMLLRQSNSGIVSALNLAISHAQGRYIARADADDLYEPERFTLQLQYLDEHPRVALVCCDYHLCFHDGTQRLMRLPPDHQGLLRRLLLRNEIMHSSVMMRKEHLVAAGCYVEKWRHLEDYELWFRIAQYGQLASIPLPLAYYRLHPGGISQKKESYQIRMGLILRLKVLAARQVPLSWARYMARHLAKAMVPQRLLHITRKGAS